MSGVSIPFENVFVNPGTNPQISLQPMENTFVYETLGNPFLPPDITQSVRVQLQSGEIFTASAIPHSNGGIPPAPALTLGLQVTGPNGQTVASQGTGLLTNIPSVDFMAPTSGTYTVTVENTWPLPNSGGGLVLTMRPIELSTGALIPPAAPPTPRWSPTLGAACMPG